MFSASNGHELAQNCNYHNKKEKANSFSFNHSDVRQYYDRCEFSAFKLKRIIPSVFFHYALDYSYSETVYQLVLLISFEEINLPFSFLINVLTVHNRTVSVASYFKDIVLYFHAKTDIQWIRKLETSVKSLQSSMHDKNLLFEWLQRARTCLA